jgi:hypothetical protein
MGGATVAIGPMDDVSGDTADGCLARGSVEVRHLGDGVPVSFEWVDPPSEARHAVQDLGARSHSPSLAGTEGHWSLRPRRNRSDGPTAPWG